MEIWKPLYGYEKYYLISNKIKNLLKQNIFLKEIAIKYNVTASAIWRIKKGYNWSHLNG